MFILDIYWLSHGKEGTLQKVMFDFHKITSFFTRLSCHWFTERQQLRCVVLYRGPLKVLLASVYD